MAADNTGLDDLFRDIQARRMEAELQTKAKAKRDAEDNDLFRDVIRRVICPVLEEFAEEINARPDAGRADTTEHLVADEAPMASLWFDPSTRSVGYRESGVELSFFVAHAGVLVAEIYDGFGKQSVSTVRSKVPTSGGRRRRDGTRAGPVSLDTQWVRKFVLDFISNAVKKWHGY